MCCRGTLEGLVFDLVIVISQCSARFKTSLYFLFFWGG